MPKIYTNRLNALIRNKQMKKKMTSLCCCNHLMQIQLNTTLYVTYYEQKMPYLGHLLR